MYFLHTHRGRRRQVGARSRSGCRTSELHASASGGDTDPSDRVDRSLSCDSSGYHRPASVVGVDSYRGGGRSMSRTAAAYYTESVSQEG